MTAAPRLRTARRAAISLRVAALLLLMLLPRPGRAAGQVLPAGFEAGLFEVRVARVAASTELALLSETGAVLVPVEKVLEMTGLPVSRSGSDSVLTLPRIGADGHATLDLGRREIRVGQMLTPLDSAELVFSEGVAYLRAERLAAFLQAQVNVDPGLLMVSFSRTPPFPAEQAALIAARRARLEELAAQAGGVPRAAVPYPARSGAGVLDWSISTTGRDPLRQASVRTDLGVALLGGDATLGLAYTPMGLGRSDADGRWSYRRGFPTSPILRQIEIGDVTLGGALGRSATGVRVGNVELARGPFFAPVLIAPDAPPGWEYEVYQDGQLLGYSDGTSRGGISVPIRYGSTPVQVKLYSPAGETITSDVLYQMPLSQLPPGRFEYGAGLGRCAQQSRCRAVGFVDADYGVARWLTLGAGSDLVTDTATTSIRPFGSLNVATLSGWTGHLQAARRGFVRGYLGRFGPGRISGSVAAGVNYPESAQPSFLPAVGRRWYSEANVGVRAPAALGVLRGVRLDARAEGAAGGAVERWRAGGRFEVPRGSVELRYETEPARDAGLWGISVLALTPASGPEWLRNQAVTLGAGWSADGRRELSLNTAARVGSVGYFGLSARWMSEIRRAALVLSYNITLRGARVQARMLTNGAAPVLTTSALGALSVGEGIGVAPLAQSGVGAAGVSGVVFQDLNGNGIRDEGEPAVANAPLVVAGRGVHTDSAGRYHTWNVLPFQVTEVRVDTARAADPSWIPLRPTVRLRPTPHLYTRVDFPLVQTRELTGRLDAAEGVATAGGVTIEIHNTESGTVQTAVTFSDGEFYLSRVRPGSYELRVAASSLQALRAAADPRPLRFTIGSEGDELFAELPPVRLIPATP